MAAEREQSPPKLVYLRERTQRPPVRRRSTRVVDEPPATGNAEAVWLSRAILAVAAFTAGYWLLLGAGLVEEHSVEGRQWLAATSVAHLFVVTTALLASIFLARDTARGVLFLAIAAAAMVIVAVEGIAHLIATGSLAAMSLQTRIEILGKTAELLIGAWGLSYCLRAAPVGNSRLPR